MQCRPEEVAVDNPVDSPVDTRPVQRTGPAVASPASTNPYLSFKKSKKVKTLKIYYSQLTYSTGVSLYQLFYVCLLVGTID